MYWCKKKTADSIICLSAASVEESASAGNAPTATTTTGWSHGASSQDYGGEFGDGGEDVWKRMESLWAEC